MTRRAGEWHLVGHDADPVPASQWDVDVVEGEMRERARDAGDMRAVLQRLADLDGWRGKAAESFAERAEEVLGDLAKVEDRYDTVATALSGWEGDVSEARDGTWRALQDAESAQQTIAANPEHQGDGEPPADQDARDSRRGNAEQALGSARSAMHAAMEAFKEAAGRAKREIENAADIWDDGWWGDFKGWVREHAELIYSIVKVLEIVAAVLGALVLVVAIVASAPFALVAAAVVIGVALLAGQSMLAAADTGKADWGDVAWSVVGLAATLVGGKATASAAKGLTRLVPAMSTRVGSQARTAALTRLAGGNRVQFQNALRITNPRNNLARWAHGIRDTAAAEGRLASGRVDDVLTLRPSLARSALFQDRGLAEVYVRLRHLRPMAQGYDELARINDVNRRVGIAVGANTVGTATWAKGLQGNVGSMPEVAQNPPWSTQPAG
jgi:uncharacterized protein YukE